VINARAALSAAVADGLFRCERQTVFDFLYHFATVDEFLAYVGAHFTSLMLGEALIAQARAALGAAGGELVIRERVSAARLRPP
jgi:hypothetical protein